VIRTVGGVRVLVDDREPTGGRAKKHDIKDLLIGRGVPAEVKRLPVSDYFWWDSEANPVLVTRKSSDLLQSAFDGHLDDELNGMYTYLAEWGGGHIWAILEGQWVAHGGEVVHPSGQRHHCPLPRLMEIYISLPPIIPTNDLVGTASALAELWDESQQGWPRRVARHKLPPRRDAKVSRLLNLWPGLRQGVAVKLLKKYDGILPILKEVEAGTLAKEPGLGPKTIQNLKEIL